MKFCYFRLSCPDFPLLIVPGLQFSLIIVGVVRILGASVKCLSLSMSSVYLSIIID